MYNCTNFCFTYTHVSYTPVPWKWRAYICLPATTHSNSADPLTKYNILREGFWTSFLISKIIFIPAPQHSGTHGCVGASFPDTFRLCWYREGGKKKKNKN